MNGNSASYQFHSRGFGISFTMRGRKEPHCRIFHRKMARSLVSIGTTTLLVFAGTGFSQIVNSPSVPRAVSGAVTIKTDKTDYKKNETVSITLKNELDRSIWFLNVERGGRNPWWGLHKLGDGHWTQREIWKPTNGECVVVASERIPIEEYLEELEPGSEKTSQWTLETCVLVSPVGPKLKRDRVESGTYRLVFSYGLDRSIKERHTCISREFSVGGSPK